MATTSERTLRLSEREFMAQVIQLARLYGWMVFHPFDSRRSIAGWPDLTLVRPPHALFVEVKTDTGRLTQAQRMWLGALEQCPAIEVHVWRPADWDAIIARLK
jgi:VRR-NUC domain